jgi:lysophospholipid acyltransferase (LPLAT)-like uncharacterized protein
VYGLKLPAPVAQQPEGPIGYLLPWVMEKMAAPVHRTLGNSWSMNIEGLENLREARKSGNFIIALWHSEITVFVYSLRDLGAVGLVSPVWEGELINREMVGMGFRTIRGSSGFQPVAGLRLMIRELKKDNPVAIAVDGPEGPRYEIKPGVINAAALSGYPILPFVGIGMKNLHLPTWDRHEIPIPFSPVTFAFGEPLFVPRRIRGDALEENALVLKKRMLNLEKGIRKSFDINSKIDQD